MREHTFMVYWPREPNVDPLGTAMRACAENHVEVKEVRTVTIADGWQFTVWANPRRYAALAKALPNSYFPDLS